MILFSGNVFVIAAIILERNLQSVANYLILSLAVADLLVAVLVMPIGAIYEVIRINDNKCYILNTSVNISVLEQLTNTILHQLFICF